MVKRCLRVHETSENQIGLEVRTPGTVRRWNRPEKIPALIQQSVTRVRSCRDERLVSAVSCLPSLAYQPAQPTARIS